MGVGSLRFGLESAGTKLTGLRGESGSGAFGTRVALSADGDAALIGALGDNGQAGGTWVFMRSGSTWSQQGAKLTGSGESADGRFGSGLALSSDGNTALIGGPYDRRLIGGGSVWAFTRSGSVWTQQGPKLVPSDNTQTAFGGVVALSADGDTALIAGGSPADGRAWVFTRSGSSWSQQGSRLTSGSPSADTNAFGASAALSSDGNVAMIGDPSDNPAGDHTGIGPGAAWVFTRSAGVWSRQGGKLTPLDEAGPGGFGQSVALSSDDGSIALIGGPADGSSSGAAWVFGRSGSRWNQLGGKAAGSGGGWAGGVRFERGALRGREHGDHRRSERQLGNGCGLGV